MLETWHLFSKDSLTKNTMREAFPHTRLRLRLRRQTFLMVIQVSREYDDIRNEASPELDRARCLNREWMLSSPENVLSSASTLKLEKLKF